MMMMMTIWRDRSPICVPVPPAVLRGVLTDYQWATVRLARVEKCQFEFEYKYKYNYKYKYKYK